MKIETDPVWPSIVIYAATLFVVAFFWLLAFALLGMLVGQIANGVLR